ncbi:MAG: nicotinate-nucleotide--dimethylbenzimidazole phosphoribosyltransferase [Blastochloris sp.]|nr:nicotinate-nucleotide--dimethylbenzimidazole phosphoribosyltransferase [Blastochloris sp.]
MMDISIPALNAHVMQQARERQDTLIKPRGALGRLEMLSIQLAGMTGRMDWLPDRRAVIVFAGDHGVMSHNISTVPQAITAYMVKQFLAGNAAINVLARQMNARLTVVDAGVNAEFASLDSTQFVAGKIAYGTADFTQSTAMTAEQAQQVLQMGVRVVENEIASGLDVLILGEMGIGNTTAASAIIAAITGVPAAEATGRGTGVDDATLARKIALIETALKYHMPAAETTLMKLGGFEIGAITGAMLYASSQRIPVIVDGLICTAAALIAQQINPDVTHYLIAGHCGAEPGHQVALNYLGLNPLLNLEMRLGEGTGAVLALPIIEAAMRTLNEMGTLDVG